MEKNNDLKKLLIVTSFVGIMLLTMLYLTYSLSQGSNRKELTASIIKVDEEAYGKTTFTNDKLDLKPILDKNVTKESNNVIYITFNVGGSKENNTDTIIYDIALADLKVNCNLLSPYLKWKLIKNGLELSQGSLDYKFDTIKDGRLVLTNMQQDLIKYSEDKSVYDKYEFYMWISDSCQKEDITECTNSESQKNLLNKKISGKIEVELYGGNKKEIERQPKETIDTTTCNE